MTATVGNVVTDMPERDYHAHPALSHSGIKTLLRSPAHYRWERDHGRPPNDNLDFGQAAHTKALGTGWESVVIQTTAKDGTNSDADDLRTKSAQEHRDQIRAAGKTPVLRKDADIIDAMAVNLLAHPIAAALFAEGQAETSLFTVDPDTGVPLRGRLDWLTRRSDRVIAVDYKTSVSSNPAEFGKTAASFHYHGQASFYADLIRDAGIDDDPAFLFVVQEKVAPYLVSVVELDHEAITTGRRENRHAIDLFAECNRTGEWPGWPTDDIALVSLPRWYREAGA